MYLITQMSRKAQVKKEFEVKYGHIIRNMSVVRFMKADTFYISIVNPNSFYCNLYKRKEHLLSIFFFQVAVYNFCL